jgi:hypothetical protein
LVRFMQRINWLAWSVWIASPFGLARGHQNSTMSANGPGCVKTPIDVMIPW